MKRTITSVLLATIGNFSIAEELPTLPLNTATAEGRYETGDYGWWTDSYGETDFGDETGRLDISTHAVMWRSGDEVDVITTIPIVEDGAELVFADGDGRFAGSWCHGEVKFSSLVLPESDGEGHLLERWSIPLYWIDGALLGEAGERECLELLQGSSLFSEDDPSPKRGNFRQDFVTTSVMALLEVERATLDWKAERFQCFQAENRVGSHASHDERIGSSVLGDAEMFLWHPAPVRLSWDLYAEDELTTESIHPEVGSNYASGGVAWRVVGVEPGIFSSIHVDDENVGRTVVSYRRDQKADGWTCFLAGNVEGSRVRRVEIQGADEKWREVPAACEDFGVISIDLPGVENVESLPDIRIVWQPKRLRVVADVPAIGGGLPENDGIATYNEIGMRFHGVSLDLTGVFWSLNHLLGYDTGHGDLWNSQDFEARIPTDSEKVYRLSDITAAWEQVNPGLTIRFDPEARTVRIAEKK